MAKKKFGYRMESTTVYLPKALKAMIAEHAKEKGIPQAEVIRSALLGYFGRLESIRMSGSVG